MHRTTLYEYRQSEKKTFAKYQSSKSKWASNPKLQAAVKYDIHQNGKRLETVKDAERESK